MADIMMRKLNTMGKTPTKPKDTLVAFDKKNNPVKYSRLSDELFCEEINELSKKAGRKTCFLFASPSRKTKPS